MRYTFILFATFFSYSLQAQLNERFTIGLRTGAAQDAYTYTRKTNKNQSPRGVRTGFNNHVFANVEMGKKRKWMLETNLGYFAYSAEETWSEFLPSGQVVYLYYLTQNKVYSLNLELRYCFYDSKPMNWKHYIGATLGINNNTFAVYAFGNTHNIDIFESGESKFNIYYNYTGFQYFGKLNLAKKLSVQYLIGYSFSSTQFTPESSTSLSGEPTNHRLNINFGLGYRL